MRQAEFNMRYFIKRNLFKVHIRDVTVQILGCDSAVLRLESVQGPSTKLQNYLSETNLVTARYLAYLL